MRAAAVCIAFVLTCTGGSFVAGIRYMDPMSPQPGNNGDIGDKRMDLTEPSCEELRAMWRYTKRQSRAAKATNGYPIYQDQVYNMWQMYPNGPKSSVPTYRGRYAAGRPRSRAAGGAPIYGRMVHKAPAGSRYRNAMRQRARLFDDLKLYGTVNRYTPTNRHRYTNFRYRGGASSPKVPQSGSFEALKNIIQAERAHELQEQHIAEEREGKIGAMNEMTENEQDPGMQQSRQYYPNLSPSLQMTPESKYYNQRRYMSHVPNIGLAWSRSGPIPREQ